MVLPNLATFPLELPAVALVGYDPAAELPVPERVPAPAVRPPEFALFLAYHQFLI